MLPQEMLELEDSKEIIKYQAHKPILCEKIKYYEEDIFMERVKLTINEKCQPKKLDVKGMLEIMRGTTKKEAESVEELPSGKEIDENQPDYVTEMSSALGFDADFFEIDVEEVA